MVSRTGYTGENGIEIIAPNERLPSIWEDLTARGVCPSGLAARDSLRFEAGFALYGHEISESVKPVDVGLSWAIRKNELSLLPGGLSAQSVKEKKLIWFTMLEKAVPRQGYMVCKNKSGPSIGEIASGMYAPSLDGFYGNCLIPFESRVDYLSGSKLYVEIHGKKRVAEVVQAPLYAPEYRRKRSDT
jgi:glycine cleavage system aminomethyltransferase T